jgi:hypothetical protein
MKIAVLHQFSDFKNTVFFRLLLQESPTPIEITAPCRADIIIYGPFGREMKTVGPFIKRRERSNILKFRFRKTQPISILHTIENYRHNDLYDYSIGYDYSSDQKRNFRFPYWMESIDWSHEGIIRSKPLRLNKYLSINRLLSPLGDDFIRKRNGRCAAFFGHLREPRKQMLAALKETFVVDGFGKAFDSQIKNSQSSGFYKDTVLRDYSYNLCPENSIYPGYYTEKIPEAFANGCLALGWADSNVRSDFNPDAFINLLDYADSTYQDAALVLTDKKLMDKYAGSALFKMAPSVEPFRQYVRGILMSI